MYSLKMIRSVAGEAERVTLIEDDDVERFVQAALLHELEETYGYKVAIATELLPATTLEPAMVQVELLILSDVDPDELWNGLWVDLQKSSCTGLEVVRDRVGADTVEMIEVGKRWLLRFLLVA